MPSQLSDDFDSLEREAARNAVAIDEHKFLARVEQLEELEIDAQYELLAFRFEGACGSDRPLAFDEELRRLVLEIGTRSDSVSEQQRDVVLERWPHALTLVDDRAVITAWATAEEVAAELMDEDRYSEMEGRQHEIRRQVHERLGRDFGYGY